MIFLHNFKVNVLLRLAHTLKPTVLVCGRWICGLMTTWTLSLHITSVSRTKDNQPCSSLLNELSLMSAGKPISPRFTVTPPNRSTFPVKALVPCALCSWGRAAAHESARTAERAGRDALLHNRPVTNGKSLEVKTQAAILLR